MMVEEEPAVKMLVAQCRLDCSKIHEGNLIRLRAPMSDVEEEVDRQQTAGSDPGRIVDG
jgi:hypothetical protein